MNKSNVSTVLNKVLLSNTMSYENTANYTTLLQVVGGNPSTGSDLGTSSSSGSFGRMSRGKVDPVALNSYLVDKISKSSLNGFIPKDGARYGIDGSPRSWANFMTNLARKESSFNTSTVGDVGRFAGNSNGLFQLSPNDALNYRIQSRPFSISQLQDPYLNTDAALTIMETLVKRDGSVSVFRNGKWGGGAAYWGPLRRGFRPTQTYAYAGVTPRAQAIATSAVEKAAKVAIEYNKTKIFPDPIIKQKEFFNNFNTTYFKELDNYQIGDYWKKFNYSSPTVLLEEVDIPNDSVLAPFSESMGMWATNVQPKYTDAVAPVFDNNSFGYSDAFSLDLNKFGTEYGGPYYIPATTINKLPDGTLTLTQDMSDITMSMSNTNLQHVYKPDENTDLFGSDGSQPTAVDLAPDISTYQSFFNNKPQYLDEFKNQFPNTFEYISFFSTINDNPGFNPRDYKSKNLEKMEDIYFEMNVEGQVLKVDILQKKYKHSVSKRTNKKSLCICGECSTKDGETQQTITTTDINRQYLQSNDSTNTLPTFISFSDAAVEKVDSANKLLAVPQQKIAELSAKIDQVGIANIPGLEGVSSAVTAPIQELLGSASGLTSILQMPLNMPNVLPSVDPGSFPQIAGLLMNTNWKNLDPGSALEIAKQINTIVCDFKLPVIGEVNFDDLFNFNFDNLGADFEKLIQGIKGKFEKSFNDFAEKLKNLVPNFFNQFKDLFKDIFTCDNKSNVKNSDKNIS